MTDSPEHPIPQTLPTTEDVAGFGAWLRFWKQNLSTPRQAWRTIYGFSEELRRDPSFWPHVMAMRGGLVMTAFASALVLAYGMTLPFTLTATAIAAVAVVGALTAVGIVASSGFIVRNVRRALHVVKNGDEHSLPARPARALPAWLEKMGDNKIMRGIGQSAAWKQTGAFINAQKKWMLGAPALGGSALTAGMGIWMLTAQAVMLPVVAVGMAVSVATLWGVGSIVTGCLGLYFGSTSLLRWHRESKLGHSKATDVTAPAAPDAPAASPVADTAPCNGDFAAASARFAVDADKTAQQCVKNPSPPPPGRDKV